VWYSNHGPELTSIKDPGDLLQNCDKCLLVRCLGPAAQPD